MTPRHKQLLQQRQQFVHFQTNTQQRPSVIGRKLKKKIPKHFKVNAKGRGGRPNSTRRLMIKLVWPLKQLMRNRLFLTRQVQMTGRHRKRTKESPSRKNGNRGDLAVKKAGNQSVFRSPPRCTVSYFLSPLWLETTCPKTISAVFSSKNINCKEELNWPEYDEYAIEMHWIVQIRNTDTQKIYKCIRLVVYKIILSR